MKLNTQPFLSNNFYKPASWLSLFSLILLTLSGCSTPAKKMSTANAVQTSTPVNLEKTSVVKQNLLAQYRIWEGTPYLLGGNSRRGIDCSGFVQRTYAEKLGHSLPRTTSEQLNAGKYVDIKKLEPGDIVFFKTGTKTRHNGIYIGNNQFMHASSSQGVTISNLNNGYWYKTYWTAIRISHPS